MPRSKTCHRLIIAVAFIAAVTRLGAAAAQPQMEAGPIAAEPPICKFSGLCIPVCHSSASNAPGTWPPCGGRGAWSYGIWARFVSDKPTTAFLNKLKLASRGRTKSVVESTSPILLLVQADPHLSASDAAAQVKRRLAELDMALQSLGLQAYFKAEAAAIVVLAR